MPRQFDTSNGMMKLGGQIQVWSYIGHVSQLGGL